MTLPTLCLDFDGVIHRYGSGWQDGTIYDDVTENFFWWAEKAREHFRLVIYSSRSATPEGIAAMKSWLLEQRKNLVVTSHELKHLPDADLLDWFEFADTKPPAFATIDDRAIRFNGDWEEKFLDPVRILNMKTWLDYANKFRTSPTAPARASDLNRVSLEEARGPVPPKPRWDDQSASPGRIVLFWKSGIGHPSPALITRVQSDTVVNMYVFPEDGTEAYAINNIVRAPNPLDPLAHTWTWPPRL